MARRKQTFWTPERLKELEQLFPKLNRAQITKKYGKSFEAIVQSYEFSKLQRKMKISTKKTKHGRTIIYRHGYAEGFNLMQMDFSANLV